MRGIVLAAGPGRRLRELTAELPKTLLPLSDGRTILDVVLANLRMAGLEEVSLVTGFAAERLAERVPDLERRHQLRIDLVFNERAEEWNNAYSLWLARDAFAEGSLIANGDTVHPSSVEETLLSQRGADVLLAVDDEKTLGEEEMKVLATNGVMERIGKEIDPASAAGEYIGVALVEPNAATPLADALEATWRRDPSLYYEDGFQELVDRGGVVGVVPMGKLDWVEVDDDEDLARAREIECHS
jgi:choline kinase